MEKLRVGLIGAGGIATDVHIPAYQKVSENVEIVAISDVVYEKAKAVAEGKRIPHAFESYEKMLEKVDLDAVSVCVPNKFHKAATITALEAGCHVLCEKPPAMSADEAQAMEDMAREKGKLLMYGFHYRYTQDVQAARRFIDGGELGNIYSARVQAIRRRGIPGWGVFTNKELQGGGPLIDIGVHMLDTALYLMGYPEPDIVLGKTHQQLGTQKGVGLLGEWDYENFTVEDMAVGMITFKNGASLVLESAFAANVKEQDVMQVSLLGNKGGADIFPLHIYQEKHGTLVNLSPQYLPETNAHHDEIHAFVSNCLQGNIDHRLAEQGTRIQKIVDGLYQSADTGRAVQL